jgi:hypothetical protein
MTATGSSLITLDKQSCARERSIYVCGELLIWLKISNSPHTASPLEFPRNHRFRAKRRHEQGQPGWKTTSPAQER